MRFLNQTKTLSAVLLLVMLTTPARDARGETSAPPKAPKAWSFEVQLYALAPWIQGDAELGYERKRLIGGTHQGSIAGDVDITPGDILANFNMAGFGHVDVHHRSGWGLWLDYMFMDLDADPDLGSRILQIDSVGLYQGIFEAFVTHRVPLGRHGYVDCFGGVRWWHNVLKAKATIDILEIIDKTKSWKRTIDWFDPVIGAQWIVPISEHWSTKLRGDIGGFGIESHFTSAVEAGLLYDITEHWRLDMRFKALWVNYEEGDVGTRNRFVYDTVSFGPTIGIIYRF